VFVVANVFLLLLVLSLLFLLLLLLVQSAPEVFAGTGHDCAADVWSGGIMAMEMAEGVPPFAAPEVALEVLPQLVCSVVRHQLSCQEQWSTSRRKSLIQRSFILNQSC